MSQSRKDDRLKAANAMLRTFATRKKTRPGQGWKTYVQTGVMEHTSGLRVHIFGMAMLRSGEVVNGITWPECRNVDRCVAECSGNRRRGVMIWAMRKQEEYKP